MRLTVMPLKFGPNQLNLKGKCNKNYQARPNKGWATR